MSGKSGRKGPKVQQLPKALRENANVKSQESRRKRLKDVFGPAVDIHMSNTVKDRLDTLIEMQQFIKSDKTASSKTFDRCAALTELINQFYFDAVIRPQTETGKEIAELYGYIWKCRVIDGMKAEAIAVELNKVNYMTPVFNETSVKWLKKKWNVERVTKMCETEHILDLIYQAEKTAKK
ncbi:hypothetical protein Q8V89_000324 [Enterobacter hormaechei]|nr:hypothetical protein [Enterobacter hormaechei]